MDKHKLLSTLFTDIDELKSTIKMEEKIHAENIAFKRGAIEQNRWLIDYITQHDNGFEGIESTISWFEQAKPKIGNHDIIAQLKCHYEEFEELAEALQADELVKSIQKCRDALSNLSDSNLQDIITRIQDKEISIAILDALCDQIVTAVGLGYMLGFDMNGALSEVNRSNFSKFEDGKPLLDEHGKIMKGKNYTKPELELFISKEFFID